jgi:hypothetical protein
MTMTQRRAFSTRSQTTSRQMRAATIAKATGADNSRDKETHRLGSISSRAEAITRETFASAFVIRDGSGYIEVSRGLSIAAFE